MYSEESLMYSMRSRIYSVSGGSYFSGLNVLYLSSVSVSVIHEHSNRTETHLCRELSGINEYKSNDYLWGRKMKPILNFSQSSD